MAHRASCKDSWGSRELTEGRDALGHHPQAAGMLLGRCSLCWGSLGSALSLLLGTTGKGEPEAGCVWHPVIRVKAVAGNNNQKLGYRSPSQVGCSKGCS